VQSRINQEYPDRTSQSDSNIPNNLWTTLDSLRFPALYLKSVLYLFDEVRNTWKIDSRRKGRAPFQKEPSRHSQIKHLASRCALIPAWVSVPIAIMVIVSSVGCHKDHRQSMLHPAGHAASQIAWLWWFLFIVCGIVFLLTMVLLGIAVFGKEHTVNRQSPIGTGFVAVCGVFIPSVILLLILAVSINSQVNLAMPETQLTVKVTGHMWWWEVEYPDLGIRTANEIHIPVGRPVRVELHSADVVHSLWIPNLQGKMDLLPDKINVTWISSEIAGEFRGQCAEYCGVQHALMAFTVQAVSESRFDEWIKETQRPPEDEISELAARGKEVFFESACHNCHAIENTTAIGIRGPDLTHLASRKTLGAGTLANNRGNLSGWITNPQAIKPGNLMPRTHITPDNLHALLEYLESLK